MKIYKYILNYGLRWDYACVYSLFQVIKRIVYVRLISYTLLLWKYFGTVPGKFKCSVCVLPG